MAHLKYKVALHISIVAIIVLVDADNVMITPRLPWGQEVAYHLEKLHRLVEVEV